MKKKFLGLIILLVFISSLTYAASSSSSSTTSNTPNAEPYNTEEIPDWLKYIRRFEIITFGSLPFTTIAATTTYTTIRWIKNDFSSSYIPNPFAFTSSAANLDTDEQLIVLYSAIGTSVLIGAIDLTIFVVKKEKAKKANKNLLPDNVQVKNKDEDKPQDAESENNAEENSEDDSSVLPLPSLNTQADVSDEAEVIIEAEVE